jgi:hypothetical protein
MAKQPDGGTLQIIYEEVLGQWKGNYRTFQTIRERLGQIIAFIGVNIGTKIYERICLLDFNGFNIPGRTHTMLP